MKQEPNRVGLRLRPIPANTVVHTPTEEEAKELLAILHENGYVWIDFNRLINTTMWSTYKDETCYNIRFKGKYVSYSEKGWFERNGATILTFAEFKKIYTEPETKPTEDMETKELNLCELLWGHEGEEFYSPVCGGGAANFYSEECLEPYTEPETKPTEDMETKEKQQGEKGNNSENSQLNLCELLQGHEGESIFLTTMGEVLVEKVSEEHLFFRLKATEPGWRLNANGKMNENGVVITYPSRELYEQYPLDPYTAWMKWQEGQKTYEIKISIDYCENFMGAVDATTLTFRTPADRDKCIEEIKAIIEKYSK